jgi:hypothetical protein
MHFNIDDLNRREAAEDRIALWNGTPLESSAESLEISIHTVRHAET